MEDQRKPHWIRDLIIPIIISVVVGIGSASVAASITVKVAIAVIENEVLQIKDDVVDLKSILGIVQQNQISKTRIELMTSNNRSRLNEVISDVNQLKIAQYTKEDAERDVAILRLEARARHKESIHE